MVNLARRAALCCTITTLICSLTSLLQLSCILLPLNREAHRNNRQRYLEMLTFSWTHYSSRVTKTKAKRRFWIRPERMRVWWYSFLNGVMIAGEWKENFRMGKDNFYKLCGELRPFIERKVTNMRLPVSVETPSGGLDFVLFVRRRTTQENSKRFWSLSSMCSHGLSVLQPYRVQLVSEILLCDFFPLVRIILS